MAGSSSSSLYLTKCYNNTLKEGCCRVHVAQRGGWRNTHRNAEAQPVRLAVIVIPARCGGGGGGGG